MGLSLFHSDNCKQPGIEMGKAAATSKWSQRRERAAERRPQIINAVLRLVDEHGVQGTTTARIAAAVGVSEPTLYTYFENRQDMLLAALDVLFDRAEDFVRLSPGNDAVERLRNIGSGHTGETAARKLGFVSPLFEFIVAPHEAGLRERARDRGLAILHLMQAIIEEGKAEGKIRADVDARRAAWRIMAFYWFEDISSLQEMTEVVDQGISTEFFDDFIAQIVVAHPGSVPVG
jgi:AcrR family transcriptional regulator